jgi:rhodanese-related sulfurtransferase
MINVITPEKLFRLVGLPTAPAIIDVRAPHAVVTNAVLIPGAVWRDAGAAADWASEYRGRATVVVCADGHEASQGVAAWLRQSGSPSEVREGGLEAWTQAALPLVAQAALPPRDPQGRTVWVTRARPKVDRIACPWLIRRFVDPNAVFLYVPTAEVIGVAARHRAAAFDIDSPEAAFGHSGERCTFDTMLTAFGLDGIVPLTRLAAIVRGADTARPDLALEAAGLLAVSLGLSRMFADDIEQLDAGLTVYDALYRWSRDAADEVHNWTSHQPAAKARK